MIASASMNTHNSNYTGNLHSLISVASNINATLTFQQIPTKTAKDNGSPVFFDRLTN